MPPFPRPTGAGFEPYVWAATVADVAARHRLSPAHVLRFDANLPPFAARVAVSPRRALAARGEYPEGSYRELREAAAAYAGCAPDELARGARARQPRLRPDAVEGVRPRRAARRLLRRLASPRCGAERTPLARADPDELGHARHGGAPAGRDRAGAPRDDGGAGARPRRSPRGRIRRAADAHELRGRSDVAGPDACRAARAPRPRRPRLSRLPSHHGALAGRRRPPFGGARRPCSPRLNTRGDGARSRDPRVARHRRERPRDKCDRRRGSRQSDRRAGPGRRNRSRARRGGGAEQRARRDCTGTRARPCRRGQRGCAGQRTSTVPGLRSEEAVATTTKAPAATHAPTERSREIEAEVTRIIAAVAR